MPNKVLEFHCPSCRAINLMTLPSDGVETPKAGNHLGERLSKVVAEEESGYCTDCGKEIRFSHQVIHTVRPMILG